MYQVRFMGTAVALLSLWLCSAVRSLCSSIANRWSRSGRAPTIWLRGELLPACRAPTATAEPPCLQLLSEFEPVRYSFFLPPLASGLQSSNKGVDCA